MCRPLVGQASAAFGATALQNITASFASHTLEETVLTRTLTLFWLVSALGH
jgi:hypothetical protein